MRALHLRFHGAPATECLRKCRGAQGRVNRPKIRALREKVCRPSFLWPGVLAYLPRFLEALHWR